MDVQCILHRDGVDLLLPLPAALAERFGLHAGDTVPLIETEAGILITPHDAETAEVMGIEARVRARYANALCALGG